MAALLAYAGPAATFGSMRQSRANALIDLDGVLDMADPQALQFEDAAGANSPFARWLGSAFANAPERWREASAASHITPQSPPTLIISSGIPRFTVGKERVIAALDRHRIAHHEFTFSNAPHDFWLFEPWLTRTAREIDVFLRPLTPAKNHR